MPFLGVLDMRFTFQISLKKDLLSQLLDEQSVDSSQHSTTSGVTSAAENHIDQSHVLPKAACVQWSIMVRIQRSNHFDPQQNNSDDVYGLSGIYQRPIAFSAFMGLIPNDYPRPIFYLSQCLLPESSVYRPWCRDTDL